MYRNIKFLIRSILNTINGFFISKKIVLSKLEKKLAIFCYHNITNNPSNFCDKYNLYVSLKKFKKQINFINKNFKIIDVRNLADPNFIIPKNAAIITFDDGFKGTFENGLKYLEEKRIPAVIFLNMDSITNNKIMVSAAAKFIEENKSDYSFLNVKKNFHYYINNLEYSNLMLDENFNYKILNYQGDLACKKDLHRFSSSNYISFGNHYYQHFDTRVLNQNEIFTQIKINEYELLKYKNYCNFFAFTNGSFNNNNIDYIKSLEIFNRLFTSSGSFSFNNSYVLDRVALDNSFGNKYSMLFCIFRALN